ncbi:hypothetical protein HW561_19285 [Rhodobacteraceae bacterium B1Z28]|uniref:Secreted protein n=1 Tax=Ruegeria haliotis TaxID=2747601 RepID=A0ABX2PWD0_9RHOB|nr:hypothetical protein [Ruegeria haliotis]NVO57946.1 hypothetical protein [Ruegeria haliotis]
MAIIRIELFVCSIALVFVFATEALSDNLPKPVSCEKGHVHPDDRSGQVSYSLAQIDQFHLVRKRCEVQNLCSFELYYTPTRGELQAVASNVLIRDVCADIVETVEEISASDGINIPFSGPSSWAKALVVSYEITAETDTIGMIRTVIINKQILFDDFGNLPVESASGPGWNGHTILTSASHIWFSDKVEVR